MAINTELLEQIKSDKELRPFFFDFVCKGFALGLSDTFEVSHTDRLRFQKDYYDKLLDLSAQVESKLKTKDVLPLINEVTAHYLSHIGRIGLETYEPDNH